MLVRQRKSSLTYRTTSGKAVVAVSRLRAEPTIAESAHGVREFFAGMLQRNDFQRPVRFERDRCREFSTALNVGDGKRIAWFKIPK